MPYSRKPNYHFKTKNDTGIETVPVGRVIVVEDFDGEIKTFIKSNNNFSAGSTIAEVFQAGSFKEQGGGTSFPADGTIGQILVNSAPGEATWQDMPATDVIDGGGA